MWEKKHGDLVWAKVSINPPTYLPGMILDSHSPEIGILVSFFNLQNPRYFLSNQLLFFEPNFKTLVLSSRSFYHRRFVKRALRFLFRSISNALSCPCTRVRPVEHFSPRSFRFCTESALGFLRNAAVSPFVPPEGLAEATSCSAQLQSFRRYTVDSDTSRAVYEDVELGLQSLHRRDGFDDSNWIKIKSLLQAHSPVETLSNVRLLAVHPMQPERAGLGTGNQIELLINLRDLLLSYCYSKDPIADSALSSNMFLKACKTMICTNEALLPSSELVESAPTHLQHLSVEQTKSVISDCDRLITPVNTKRKMDENESLGNSLKRSRVANEGSSIDKPTLLFMKFMRYTSLPTKGELIKRFSRFGKIDVLRTEVFSYTGSAKVVFKEHIDAVTALEYGKSNKIAFGQGTVIYWLGCEDGNEKKQMKESQLAPKSCLKTKSGSAKRDSKRKRVRFRLETKG